MPHDRHEFCHVSPIEKSVDPAALARASEVVLLVRGMGCPTCALRVRNALLRVRGVLSAFVVLREGSATVYVDPALASASQLLAAVSQAGVESGHNYIAAVVDDPAAGPSVERR